MISVRAISRVMLAAFVLSLGFTLAGCENTKLMEMFDGKKKLPGERKEVFPGGVVPGVQVGVPPELMKGYHDPAAMSEGTPAGAPSAVPGEVAPAASASAAPPPVAEPEARPEPKPKPKPKPKRTARPKPSPAPKPAPQQASAPPPAPPQQQQAAPAPANGGLLPWPGETQNAAPPPNRFSR